MDNYKIQADQARAAFLTYDHEKLIRKHRLDASGEWIRTALFGQPYRINRRTGQTEKWEDGWVPGNGFGETMTLLDLVCDSREDRHISGHYRNMTEFGLMFHRQLHETDPWAQRFQEHFSRFCRACEALGGVLLPRMAGADVTCRFDVTPFFPVLLQFWEGDEDFPPKLMILWDRNANSFLHFETTFYLQGDLLKRLMDVFQNR